MPSNLAFLRDERKKGLQKGVVFLIEQSRSYLQLAEARSAPVD